jgi:catechol 2,3-dioxygenase-like lactoylglutathione lyase family enzyme
MNSEKEHFSINNLDHVAIRVRDLDISAQWYEDVLGLKRYVLPQWGAFPVFMLAGKSGIALFPIKQDEAKNKGGSLKTCIDHFAFNVDNSNFKKARKKYSSLGLDFSFQDHHYFHSIYTKDPDGHTVELTTLVVDQNDFYK